MRPCVTLIGAGPGDPELLTLKAARVLGAADVVLVDELVNRGCLAHVRAGAKVIEVGKRGGCKSTPQAFIEKLLILYAKEKKNVRREENGQIRQKIASSGPLIFRLARRLRILLNLPFQTVSQLRTWL